MSALGKADIRSSQSHRVFQRKCSTKWQIMTRSIAPLSSHTFREVSPHDRFGDERRPVLPLDFDGDVARQLQAALDLIHFRQHEATADSASAADGRGEANRVESVVQAQVAEWERVLQV